MSDSLNPQELWQNALAQIEMSISKTAFRTWFSGTKLVKYSNGYVTIAVPNTMVKEWLQDKYGTLIIKSLRNFDESIRSVTYKVSRAKTNSQDSICASTSVKNQQILKMPAKPIDKRNNLNPRYTFETFIVGPFNELAYSAAQAVIKKPALTYNPYFVYGNTGYGKTHLIQAMGNEIIKLNPDAKVYYVTSEKFSQDYINAVKEGKANTFKEKYRSYDILIMDDIQFIASTEKTQEELFHLFNYMYNENKQIVFSSDKHPNSMPGLEDRLKSRFSAGIIVEITKPDMESREIIIKEKAKEKNINLSDEVIHYIAKEVNGNIRELEGALNTLYCQIQIKDGSLTISDAQKLIKKSSSSKSVSIKDVIKKVCEYYQVDEEEIYKKTRKKSVVLPRQIIMYLLREDFGISLPQIGEELGGRDHTTVIHSYEKIKKLMETNKNIEDDINSIRSMF